MIFAKCTGLIAISTSDIIRLGCFESGDLTLDLSLAGGDFLETRDVLSTLDAMPGNEPWRKEPFRVV